jgi:hypothetical protein
MPKLSYRCCNRRTQGISHAPSSVAFMAPPRKVSFEDGPMAESETADLPVSPLLRVLIDEPALLTHKPTLVRPKSSRSRSLVDLAGSIDEEEENDSSFYRYNYQQTPGETTTSGSSAVPVSPVNHYLQQSPSHCGDSSSSTPSSPWGQFVDMIIPHQDSESRAPMLHHYPDAPCSCCPSCRRRRGSPYGDYMKKKNKSSLNHKDSPLLLGTPTTSWSLPTSFRLAPTKEPTDQLVGALHRLQV